LVSQLLSKLTVTSYNFYINIVSALLLDDAFKLATSLTNGVINEMLRQFVSLSDVSQGSVATHLTCGGIISDVFISNFPPILTVNMQFRKSVNI